MARRSQLLSLTNDTPATHDVDDGEDPAELVAAEEVAHLKRLTEESYKALSGDLGDMLDYARQSNAFIAARMRRILIDPSVKLTPGELKVCTEISDQILELELAGREAVEADRKPKDVGQGGPAGVVLGSAPEPDSAVRLVLSDDKPEASKPAADAQSPSKA